MRKTKAKPQDVLALIESRMSAQSIRRSDAKAAKLLLGYRLADFRRSLGKRQAAVKGFPQPAVSKIEGHNDIRLSTLVEYCKGLGAELTITARGSHAAHARDFVLLQA